ncbi:tetratricopeptide (TPR) repeat protein [Sphingomonas kaistensis]|uniref:Tetratricopeptide (TPR) repeat protein n=1 Tax=Sphingomonas kaistensis TaxID=298708 RepID=A0A7X5Y5H3_9SPHN|nr:hypothetical protein [Sphingomonas kaistensis]NJC04240.1 tetratricopeptide (TPR) repeat protein [Sphingomonas kaistensis]
MSVDLTPWLIAGAFAAFGVGLLIYCVRGFRRGRIVPMIRYYRNEPYDRRREPKRFWVSLIYNGLLAGGLVVGSMAALQAERRRVHERPFRDACLADRPDRTPYDVIAACDRWIAEARPWGFDLGLARATQAHAHSLLGEREQATLLRRAAIGAYGRSLSGYPEDSAAHWNSAALMVANGDFEQARLSLEAYVALEPDRGNGWLELGMVDLWVRKPQDAIVNLTRAVERLPGEARPLAGRGLAFLMAGDRERAAADIGAARKLDPDHPLVTDAVRMLGPESPQAPR